MKSEMVEDALRMTISLRAFVTDFCSVESTESVWERASAAVPRVSLSWSTTLDVSSIK